MNNKVKAIWMSFQNNLDPKLFKAIFQPLGPVMASVIGNTAGIWFGWLLIKFIYVGFFDHLEWPGIESLINEGVLLLISFSFLSAIIFESSKSRRINWFNSLGALMLLGVCLFYSRAIGLRQVQKAALSEEFEPDYYIYVASLVAFFGSILLLYLMLARHSYIKYIGNHPRSDRQSKGDELKRKFHGA